MFVAVPGCFTGVESTPRIQPEKEKAGVKETSAEANFFSPISKQRPSEWRPGKRFNVVDERFSRLLGATTPAEELKGQVISLIGVHPVATFTSDSVMEVSFSSAVSDTPLVYRTAVSPDEWRGLQAFEIPFLVETDLVTRAADLLTGKQLWVRGRSGWLSPHKPRFVPVMIDSVSAGNETYPLAVYFHDLADTERRGKLFLSDAGARPDDRHAFGAYFSLTDPRVEYPGIREEIWQAIIAGRPVQGMTPNEVRLCLGAPQEVRNVNTSSLLRQEWVYADGRMLLFENQLLVSWN